MNDDQEDIVATVIFIAGLIISGIVSFFVSNKEPCAIFIAFVAYLFVTHFLLIILDSTIVTSPTLLIKDDEWEDVAAQNQD